MKCKHCELDFEEKEIQESHDVPKYMGGTDADGRHHLCARCHDIYERLVRAIAMKEVPEGIKVMCRERVKKFAQYYFRGKDGKSI